MKGTSCGYSLEHKETKNSLDVDTGNNEPHVICIIDADNTDSYRIYNGFVGCNGKMVLKDGGYVIFPVDGDPDILCISGVVYMSKAAALMNMEQIIGNINRRGDESVHKLCVRSIKDLYNISIETT